MQVVTKQQTPEPFIFRMPGGGLMGGEPHEVYQGYRNQRGELRDQLERLVEQRQELAQELPGISNPVARTGLEQRITQTDMRIAEVEQAIAQADANVARAAALPGAIIEEPPPPPFSQGPPEEFWVITGFILVPSAFILTVAYARRIWRRGAAVAAQLPDEFAQRLARMEQGIEAVAVEVERIGEGQRYLTRMYTERGLGAGAGAAQPIDQKARAAEPR